MAKIIRSNSPLALSVAAMTVLGNVRATTDRILEFDDAKIGFTHSDTWDAMPAARRGVIKSDSEHIVFSGTHPRVESCIRALCRLGEMSPVETRRFADYPKSGLRPISQIEWGPQVIIRVKGVCWYVKDGTPVIPLLQPRKVGLSEEGLSLYAALGRQAYCRDDWHNAVIELNDLSGDDKIVSAAQIFDHELTRLSESQVAKYVSTFVEAKAAVDLIRAARPKKPKPRGDDLFDPKHPE